MAAVRNGDHDLVLIGDSITHTIGELGGKYEPMKAVWDKYYAPRNAINLGFNGYRTEQILWNLQNGELDFAHSPEVAMLLIGTNNSDDRHFKTVHTAEQILAGTKAIVELIRERHPTTKILVLRILNNTIGNNADVAAIGGGSFNTIGASSSYSTIGGGTDNSIATISPYATIGGGFVNSIEADADYAVIGGGRENQVLTNAGYATLSGGYSNCVEASATSSTIAGGIFNMIQSNAKDAAIGGGGGNTVQANSSYGIIPGGLNNSAASHAFAAGTRSKANHIGTFVWGDSVDADVESTGANSVTMRASVGFRFFSNAAMASGVSLAPNGNSWRL